MLIITINKFVFKDQGHFFDSQTYQQILPSASDYPPQSLGKISQKQNLDTKENTQTAMIIRLN